MDPNACLREIRDLTIIGSVDDIDQLSTNFDRLAELIQGLDHWLSKGGYPPKDWNKRHPDRPRKDNEH